jgi:cell division inhibitor SepF
MSKDYFGKFKEFFGFVELNDTEETEVQEEKRTQNVVRAFKGTLVNNQNAQKFSANEIKVLEPRVYEDSLNISMYLRENVPVIINLKYLDSDASKRLIDFVCGTAYAINGHMMKIGENIFLFTPSNILIADSGEKTDFEQGLEQEEKEIFFKKTASL